MARRSALVPLVLTLLIEPAAAQQVQCVPPQRAWMVAQLLFGRAHVSEAGWKRFVAEEITPRFPDGLTVYDVNGQWRAPGSARITRERSKVVMIAAPPAPETDSRLRDIVAAYKTRFKQQSVGLIIHPACVSF